MTNGFNPRTRESATPGEKVGGEFELVSIHALVRVRLYALEGENLEFKFQSTHS